MFSREIIKPSSPTPFHHQKYNLSQLDQSIPHVYLPLILFYPNNNNCSLTPDDKARKLKKSLSQSLTRYYPFAGRLHTPTTPYIDCNDDGVVFVEAKNHSQLSKFQHMRVEDDTFGQLFADGMVWLNSPHRTSLVGVQLNHFACGGTAVAVSMSHKIGDGCTLGCFSTHWASVARYGSTDHKEVLPLNPHFIQSPSITLPETSLLNQKYVNRVTRKFVLSNSKLNELKNKVLALAKAGSINNPTRVEVLASLIYKTAVTAATKKSGSFNPSLLLIPANLRKKYAPNLPQTTVGNFVGSLMVTTGHESETSLDVVVSEIQKEKMALDRVQDPESFYWRLGNEDDCVKRWVWCSSLCGFPFDKVDFGWGKPAGASVIFGSADRDISMLIDTPNGIEARVALEEEDMEIFENDKELLSFCQY